MKKNKLLEKLSSLDKNKLNTNLVNNPSASFLSALKRNAHVMKIKELFTAEIAAPWD